MVIVTLVVELQPLDSRLPYGLTTGIILGPLRLGLVGSVSFSGFLIAEIPRVLKIILMIDLFQVYFNTNNSSIYCLFI